MTSRVLVVLAAASAVLAGCSAVAGTGNTEGDDPAPTVETTHSDDNAAATEMTTAAPSESGDDQPPVEPVAWSECGEGLQCGSVSVPLDYSDPASGALDIALVRVPATGEPIGSIFVNPGGPGVSGIEFVRGGFRFDPETARRYDLIGFDPRGIGRSEALACTFERAGGPLTDLSPDTAEEISLLDQEAAGIAASCTKSDGSVLPHLTTANVARDLDRLRHAVGDATLHYYGLSYGTLLAVRYGQLFPESVGHLVLDGVVDPTAGLTDLLRQQAAAFETQFGLLDERCSDSRCPVDGVTATFDRVHDRLESDGPVDGVGASELVIASLLPAYSPSVFPAYAAALRQADGGDYTAIETLSDFIVSSFSYTAYAAFACADGQPPSGSESWEQFAADLDELAPRFGAVVANELRVCAFWPTPDSDPFNKDTTAESLSELEVPVLVIGNTGDAATPLENAEQVASLLPDARLIVLESDRHTAYNGSACVRELVSDYFADRQVAELSTCEAE